MQYKGNTFICCPQNKGVTVRVGFSDKYNFNSESQEFSPLSGDATVRKSIPLGLRACLGEGSGSSQTLWVGSHAIGDFFLSDDKNQSPIQRVKKRCQYRDTFCRFILWLLEWTVQFLSNLNFGSANCRTFVFFNYQNFTQQSTNNWMDLRHGHILFATHVGSYFWKVFQYVVCTCWTTFSIHCP